MTFFMRFLGVFMKEELVITKIEYDNELDLNEFLDDISYTLAKYLFEENNKKI